MKMLADYVNDINNLQISEIAKQFRIRELKRETATRFTKKWLLEYFRGERSALSAWFTWLFCFRGIFFVALFSLFTPIFDLGHLVPISLFAVIVLFMIIFTFIGAFVLWRCSKNSTRIWRSISRIYCLITILSLFIFIIANVFPLYITMIH